MIRLKVRSILRQFMKNMTIRADIRKTEQGNPFSLYRLESELALSETANAVGDDMRVKPRRNYVD